MISGVDYADEDGNEAANLEHAKEAGLRFVYLRRSHCYHDPAHNAYHLAHDRAYAAASAAARAAGIPVGGYMLPSCDKGAPSVAEQVANFLHAEGDVQPHKDFPPALDVEFPGAGLAATGRSRDEVLALLEQYVEALYNAFGTWPVIYSSYNQFYDLGLPSRARAPKLSSCPLWVKTAYHEPVRRPVDHSPPMPHTGDDADDPQSHNQLPPCWSSWWIQQYQGDALGYPGFPGKVDVDRFNPLVASGADLRLPWLAARLHCQENVKLVADTLRDLQAKRGLEADAIVGPRTFALLAW